MRLLIAAASIAASALFAGNAFAATPQIDWLDPHSVVDAALAASPALLRVSAASRSARERVTAAGSLPNPMVMSGVQNEPIDLRYDNMTMYMIGASQTLPRKAKRDAARERAEIEVRRVGFEAQSIRAEVEREVLFAWYDIASADSEIAATRTVRDLSKVVVQAARARYETGSGAQSDMIRAELLGADLSHQTLTLEGQRRNAMARLLPLLDLPSSTVIPALAMHHTMAAPALSGPVAVPDSHPVLAALQSLVDESEADVHLARLAYKPDLTVEATYGVRPRDRDMVSLTGRIELPFRKKTLLEPRVREALANEEAARQQIEEARRRLLADMGIAAAAHAEATEQIEFHEKTLVPLAKTASESALASYQAGKGNFESVLNAMMASRRLEIDYYDFVARHAKAIADFEALRKGARSGALGGSPIAIGASPSASMQ